MAKGYVSWLVFVDFVVAFAGAFSGIHAYFWYVTIHCGP